MNRFALVSFIGSFFIGLVGVIFGHISLPQIKKTGERGRGFALAGLIIGYVHTVVAIIVSISLIVMMMASFAVLNDANTVQEEWNKQIEELSEELDEWAAEIPGDDADAADESESAWADFDKRLEERDRFFAEQQLPTDGSLPKAVTPEQKQFFSDVQERGFAIESALGTNFEPVVISMASDACETAILNGGDITELNARSFTTTSPIVQAMTQDASDADRMMITAELMQIVRMGTPYMCPDYAPQWIDSIDAVNGTW